ncbi:hypothetical protein J4E90_002997 [Alternaria incomplexa]|uniref:uncharacterized protein n=1 Tax=Alternaria incomplexa TaxID=1187928 RepID=UPI0022208270|nr:uncharacterized protein J4E90_002997 [Alternaria incomplexa]KAI4918611.1 hypothetical protein J4E90_002997 [Alternaria incomplexa]
MSDAQIEENIDLLFNFGVEQLDRQEARQLLANHGNNVEAAMDKYFSSMDQGGISALKTHLRNSQAKWDETAFAGAGYGIDDTNVPSLDNYPHSNVNSRAPTRPPSRTSVASTQAQAGDAPIQSIEGQEMGVTGSSNFRPATGDNYDTSQWALVPTTTEIIADPIPSQRKREEGQPAILKPSPNFNYLTNLIPILHSIPLFRNALLCPGVLQNDYWQGDNWWKGNPTATARIFEDGTGLSEAYNLEILHETQRLMAFLDNTDRIYGSINGLLESEAWREQPSLEDPDDDLLKFLVTWGFAFQSQVPNVDLNGHLKSTFDVAGTTQESFVLDATVTRNKLRPDFNLYDVLDDSLFASAGASAHIREASNVLILRLNSSNTEASDLGCRIPATLYIDRYLEKNKHVIDSMYSEITQHEEQLVSLKTRVERLKYHTPKKAGAKKVESLQLLKTSMAAFEPESSGVSSKDAEVLAQLQDLYNSIESKLATLEEQTEQAQKAILGISERFKPRVDGSADEAATTDGHTMDTTTEMTEKVEEKAPEPVEIVYPEGQAPEDAMKRPYQLWGVATRRDVVYVRHPDIKSDIPNATQWWRMQYDSESANPVIRRDPLSLQEVIERATTEAGSALLVYANEDATAAEPLPLPKPLQDFAKRDNLNFLHELQENATGWEGYGDYGNTATGGWDNTNPPAFEDNGWSEISAKEFNSSSRPRNDSNMSSATLTPNTEIDDDAPVTQEMVETNRSGGAGTMSSASSETVGRGDDLMDIDAGVHEKMQSQVRFSDVDMEDVDSQDRARVQRVDVLEKKGG